MSVVGISAIETLAVFVVLAVIAIRTKSIFLKWGESLFAALIALIVAEIICFFLFPATVTQLVLSGIGTLIFSGYVLYDIQRVYRKGYDTSVPLMVVSVYLDILNLFMSLVNINTSLSKK